MVSPCRCLATAVAGLLGGVLPAELSWLLIDQRRLASGRWSLWTASQRSDVVAPAGNAGAPGHAVRRQSVFTIGCPPRSVPTSGSGRPAIRCPAVRCPAVRCPVSWFRRPGSGCPAVRCPPVGVRPAGVRASARSPPSRPRQPGGGLGDHVGAAGNLHNRDGSSCRWSAVSRAAWSGAESAWRGTVGRWWGGRWGSGDRGPGRVRPGPRLRSRSTADRPGRPVRREGRRWLPAEPGRGARVQARRSWPWRGGISAQSMTTLRGRCGA